MSQRKGQKQHEKKSKGTSRSGKSTGDQRERGGEQLKAERGGGSNKQRQQG
ncbi:MAG TPA: hypothetical protein VJU83_03780 [Burkholderiales bacterium]|nr:hypothetical protein [Burkholderiales bacterium]